MNREEFTEMLVPEEQRINTPSVYKSSQATKFVNTLSTKIQTPLHPKPTYPPIHQKLKSTNQARFYNTIYKTNVCMQTNVTNKKGNIPTSRQWPLGCFSTRLMREICSIAKRNITRSIRALLIMLYSSR